MLGKDHLPFFDLSLLETRVTQENISKDMVSAGALPLGSEQWSLQK